MEVASRLFAERGYDATTTAAIAEAAGITEPVLYRHFESKEDMFKAILCDVTEKTMRYWQSVLAGIPDPTEQFRRMGDCFGEYVVAMRLPIQIIQSALATSHNTDIKLLLHRHFTQFAALISDMVRRGQQAGIFRSDVDPILASWVLINIGTGHALVKLSLNIKEMDAKTAVELAINGLRA
jgi:AcrR family transcriptional regulator